MSRVGSGLKSHSDFVMAACAQLRTLAVEARTALMKQNTIPEVLSEVRRHTAGNRLELEQSKRAGCVSCCHVFDAKEVTDWRDEWTSPETKNRVKRWTAMCPRCGEPTVIGSTTGLLEDQAYLPVVNDIISRERIRGLKSV